jgi:hypothetical protein
MLGPASSLPSDFDFVIGKWTVTHRRLRERLAGNTEWIEFPGTMETHHVLGGLGNVEDNVLHLPDGTYRAVALRSYHPAEKAWAIWWLDGRAPWTLDTPVKGSFREGVGLFFADETFQGKPIKIRFTWSQLTVDLLRWEQAFSPDAGATWETNWTMDFTRAA